MNLGQLVELEKAYPHSQARNVEVVAIGMDNVEDAAQMAEFAGAGYPSWLTRKEK